MLTEDEKDSLLDKLNMSLIYNLSPGIAFLAVSSVLGVAGNAMVMHIYYVKMKPNPTRSYILSISLLNVLVSVWVFCADIVKIRFFYDYPSAWFCKLDVSIRMFLTTFSCTILVMVALERHSSIFTARKHTGRIMNRCGGNTCIKMTTCFVYSLFLAGPESVLEGGRTKMFYPSNLTGVICHVADSYVESDFPVVFSGIRLSAFCLAAVIICCTYSRITRRLIKHNRQIAMSFFGINSKVAVPATVVYPASASVIKAQVSYPDVSEVSASKETQKKDSVGSGKSTPPNLLCSSGFMTPSQSQRDLSLVRSRSASQFPNAERSKKVSLNVLTPYTKVEVVKKTPPTQIKRVQHRDATGKTTLMLFVLTLLFFASYVPYFLVTVFRYTMPSLTENMGGNLFFILSLSYMMNSNIHPFVYLAMSKQVRQECSRLLKYKCIKTT